MTQKNVRFPLYRNINHTRRRLKIEKFEQPRISVITLGDNSAIVSSKVCQTIPPRTGKLISVNIDKTLVNNPAESVFSFKNSFIQKINKLHSDRDESYLGLNSIDQAVSVSDADEVEVYFFNESPSPVTISSNCVIGSVSIPEHHPSVIDMTSVMTIAEDPSLPSDWMNNTPSAKLPQTSHSRRREYVWKVLDLANNTTLKEHPNISNQLTDLIMIF